MLFSRSDSANRWLWRVIVAFAIIIPLFVSPTGKDAFRFPKELLFRAEAIILAAASLGLLCTRQLTWPLNWKRAGVILPAAIVVWSLTTTLTATNHAVSWPAFFWIAGWTLIFVLTAALAKDASLSAVYVVLIPAVINAVLVLLQEADIWNPFFPGKGLEHVYHSALIGNPNDIGSFLVLPTVASFALIFASPHQRLLRIATAALLVVGAVANHTLTALVALTAGLIATVVLISRKWAVAAVLLAILSAVLSVHFYPPLKTRYELSKRFAAAGDYDTVLSGRLLPYVTACQMFVDQPFLGVGPGCFKWEFFPQKEKATRRQTPLPLLRQAVNYGEVHNDHLQILAEAGLPGYVLFLATLVVIGAGSFRRVESATVTEKRRFSRLASAPLALALAVLALGQFPLELAASLAATVYLLAFCRSANGETFNPAGET